MFGNWGVSLVLLHSLISVSLSIPNSFRFFSTFCHYTRGSVIVFSDILQRLIPHLKHCIFSVFQNLRSIFFIKLKSFSKPYFLQTAVLSLFLNLSANRNKKLLCFPWQFEEKQKGKGEMSCFISAITLFWRVYSRSYRRNSNIWFYSSNATSQAPNHFLFLQKCMRIIFSLILASYDCFTTNIWPKKEGEHVVYCALKSPTAVCQLVWEAFYPISPPFHPFPIFDIRMFRTPYKLISETLECYQSFMKNMSKKWCNLSIIFSRFTVSLWTRTDVYYVFHSCYWASNFL